MADHPSRSRPANGFTKQQLASGQQQGLLLIDLCPFTTLGITTNIDELTLVGRYLIDEKQRAGTKVAIDIDAIGTGKGHLQRPFQSQRRHRIEMRWQFAMENGQKLIPASCIQRYTLGLTILQLCQGQLVELC